MSYIIFSLFIYTGYPIFAQEPVGLLTQNLSGTAFKNKQSSGRRSTV